MPKFHIGAIIKATIPAVIAFLLLDISVEYVIQKFTGHSFLQIFEQKLNVHYGPAFHILNLVLFSAEMFLIMILYALLRSTFPTRGKPLLIISIFIMAFAALFLGQMLNLGIYPVFSAIIFGVSSLIGFPFSLFVGASVYDRITENVE